MFTLIEHLRMGVSAEEIYLFFRPIRYTKVCVLVFQIICLAGFGNAPSILRYTYIEPEVVDYMSRRISCWIIRATGAQAHA